MYFLAGWTPRLQGGDIEPVALQLNPPVHSTVSGNPHMGPVDEAQEAHYKGTFTQTIFLRN